MLKLHEIYIYSMVIIVNHQVFKSFGLPQVQSVTQIAVTRDFMVKMICRDLKPFSSIFIR